MKQKMFTPPNLPNLELPIMEIKGGADYMKVPYRVLWMVNDIKSEKKAHRYSTKIRFEKLTEEFCTVVVTVTTYDDQGNQLNQVEDTASETKKAFNDYVEKATTSALGRALAQLGYGTAQAISDLDEGQIADSPVGNTDFVANTKQAPSVNPPTGSTGTTTTVTALKPASTFNKKKAASAPSNVVPMTNTTPAPQPAKTADDEWA